MGPIGLHSRSFYLYSLDAIPFFWVSSLARSLSTFRRIFPDGFLGIASRKTTPPVIRLIGDTFPLTNSTMSSAVALCPGFKTIYARGRSSSSLFVGNHTLAHLLVRLTITEGAGFSVHWDTNDRRIGHSRVLQ